MNGLLDFCDGVSEEGLHKDKQEGIGTLTETLIEEGKTPEAAKAEAEITLCQPDKFHIKKSIQSSTQYYKEVKIFLTDEQVEEVKKFIPIREYQGHNIDRKYLMSLVKLMKQGGVVYNKKTKELEMGSNWMETVEEMGK